MILHAMNVHVKTPEKPALTSRRSREQAKLTLITWERLLPGGSLFFRKLIAINLHLLEGC